MRNRNFHPQTTNLPHSKTPSLFTVFPSAWLGSHKYEHLKSLVSLNQGVEPEGSNPTTYQKRTHVGMVAIDHLNSVQRGNHRTPLGPGSPRQHPPEAAIGQ